VRLPEVVKREIAASLRSSSGNLTNGEATLRRYGMLDRFSWSLRGEDGSYTYTMLVWHIATNYCEIALPEVEDSQQKEYREVASTLSRYCAYLIAYTPELLPGNSADHTFIVGKVMEEANEALPRGKDSIEPTVVNSLLSVADSDMSSRRIFVQGLRLGRELEEDIEASVPRWKMMAEFWAEIILYVAPSNNFSGHIEQLANGGELLTHIWALLSHAGILSRPKEHEDIV
jgi:hypothetical protein